MPATGGSYSGFGQSGSDDSHHHTGLYILLAVILALVAVGLLFFLLAPPTPERVGMMGYAWWPFGLFWGILWLLIIVWVISWVVRGIWWTGMGYSRRHARRWYASDSAMAIARERYARGEITREQFDQVMRDLENRPGGP